MGIENDIRKAQIYVKEAQLALQKFELRNSEYFELMTDLRQSRRMVAHLQRELARTLAQQAYDHIPCSNNE